MSSLARVPRRPVHGVLLLDKPIGRSSNQALQAAKRLLSAEKAGHTGTLDPLATGLLPLCFGEATKFSQTLLDADKAYEATLKLGERTDTLDAEGVVIARAPVDVSVEQLQAAILGFTGAIDQIPPMHSALKRDGKPLYEYARAGVTLERPARRVTIHALRLLDFDGIFARISVDCSKGTYIRTLVDDIGQVLGCGAHLTALRRTRIGRFDLSGAVTMDALEATEQREALLQPVDALLVGLPRLALSEVEGRAVLHGQRVPMPQLAEAQYRLYAESMFLGVAELRSGVLHPMRLTRNVPSP